MIYRLSKLAVLSLILTVTQAYKEAKTHDVVVALDATNFDE